MTCVSHLSCSFQFGANVQVGIVSVSHLKDTTPPHGSVSAQTCELVGSGWSWWRQQRADNFCRLMINSFVCEGDRSAWTWLTVPWTWAGSGFLVQTSLSLEDWSCCKTQQVPAFITSEKLLGSSYFLVSWVYDYSRYQRAKSDFKNAGQCSLRSKNISQLLIAVIWFDQQVSPKPSGGKAKGSVLNLLSESELPAKPPGWVGTPRTHSSSSPPASSASPSPACTHRSMVRASEWTGLEKLGWTPTWMSCCQRWLLLWSACHLGNRKPQRGAYEQPRTTWLTGRKIVFKSCGGAVSQELWVTHTMTAYLVWLIYKNIYK